MVIVHVFNEWLDICLFEEFLLAHGFGDFSGRSSNTCNQAVAEFSVLFD